MTKRPGNNHSPDFKNNAPARRPCETAEKASLFGKAGATEPIQEMIACRRVTQRL